MSSKVTFVFEQMKQSNAEDIDRTTYGPSPRQVIEHAVLFNMPFLQGDQEANILLSLYNVQFQADHVLGLSVGRVLNHPDFCTHALIIRFPTIHGLLEFYESQVHLNITAKVAPFVHGVYTVDYSSTVSRADDKLFSPTAKVASKWVSLSFLKVKDEVCAGKAEENLKSLCSLPKYVDYVEELTVGPNLYMKDHSFSHSYAMYFDSYECFENLSNNHRYQMIMKDKVVPWFSKLITINFLSYKPVLSKL